MIEYKQQIARDFGDKEDECAYKGIVSSSY